MTVPVLDDELDALTTLDELADEDKVLEEVEIADEDELVEVCVEDVDVFAVSA